MVNSINMPLRLQISLTQHEFLTFYKHQLHLPNQI